MSEEKPEPSKKELKKAEKLKKREEKKKRQLLQVSENCKGCGAYMALDQRFCASCGAKRMYNRLNSRNLFEDFTERFLNLEAHFPKTFIALFTKPEDVINGYINGTRKKYLSAFSYFAVAITLGSIYIFVFRNWVMTDESGLGQLFQGFDNGFGSTSGNVDMKNTKEVVDFFLDYNSFLSFLFIPLYALLSKIVFWNYKRFNFIEHLVIYLYSYAQTQIITNVLLLLFMWTGTGQIIVSFFTSILPFFYTGYVLYRVFDLTATQLVLKTLLFLVILFPFSCIVMGSIGGIAYGLGGFDSFIEAAKQQSAARKAARDSINAVKDSLQVDTIKQIVPMIKDSLQLLRFK